MGVLEFDDFTSIISEIMAFGLFDELAAEVHQPL